MAYNHKQTKKNSDSIKPNIDIFMILGNILVDKDTTLYEHHIKNELFSSVFSSYMILRYLSLNSNVFVRNIILNHQTILENLADRPELMYKILLKIIPKTYNRFTPYIKSGFNQKHTPVQGGIDT